MALRLAGQGGAPVRVSAQRLLSAQTSSRQGLKENCRTPRPKHVRTVPAGCFSAGMFSPGKQEVTNCGGPGSRRKK